MAERSGQTAAVELDKGMHKDVSSRGKVEEDTVETDEVAKPYS